MNLSQTLKLLHKKEVENGKWLQDALALRRNRQLANLGIIHASNAFYLPAVNSKARIKWGRIFIKGLYDHFQIPETQHGPNEPVFLVTIADRAHLTTDQPQKINLAGIKRKLRSGLKGLSYVGMIEPGYYTNIYESKDKVNNIVSWHGHFIVWGISDSDLARHLKKAKRLFTPIMPCRCAVHKKQIEPEQFGYKLWYINKSPRKEYSIGKRKELDEPTGDLIFQQNKRDLRPGNRIKLFNLMCQIYLDQLAMAGGVGSELLRKIKYEALREYRTKNGWNDRRP